MVNTLILPIVAGSVGLYGQVHKKRENKKTGLAWWRVSGLLAAYQATKGGVSCLIMLIIRQ